MAVVEDASLEARVDRVVEAEFAARRPDLERLVSSRFDMRLARLVGEIVDAELSRRCSQCGGYPLVRQRTVCAACHRARARELHQARVARRRNGSAPAGDDEEPHPARTSRRRKPRHERPGRAESPPWPAARVNGWAAAERVENCAGIAADELAARARQSAAGISAAELESWLRDAGLADVTAAGLLVPTRRAIEIAGALGAS